MILPHFIPFIFGVCVLALAVLRMRHYQLKERYTLAFVLLGLPFFVLAVWPSIIGRMAHFLHITYGTVSLLCVLAFLLLMIFELLTIVSQQDRKIDTLAQIVGIIMERHGMNDRPPVQPSQRQPSSKSEHV